MLVEIFLGEKNVDDAWDEAMSGGCENHLWLRLAEATSEDHADRAYLVYKELIPLGLNRTNNDAYSEAIELLTKMRKLTTRMSNQGDYDDHLTALRIKYKRKRNFMQMLDTMHARS